MSRAGWAITLDIGALLAIWLGTFMLVWVGIPDAFFPLTGSDGAPLVASDGAPLMAMIDPEPLRRYFAFARPAMALITLGMGWQTWVRYRAG